MKAPYPSLAVLSAMLRADDDRAVRYVVSELKRAGGNMQATADAIGCSHRTLYTWRDSTPRLAAEMQKHAMGREGAGPNAARFRTFETKGTAVPKKSARKSSTITRK